MLRAKQLSTISQCARSFYVSGSRCGGSDGASCTCPEDDKCVSKRHSNHAGFRSTQKTFHIAPDTAGKVGSPSFQNAVGSISPHNCEKSGYADSVPCILSTGKANPVNGDIHASQKGLMHQTKMTAERFVKPSIASVGMFSDLMNYKVPTTDGQSRLVQHECVVDSTQPLPGVRTNEKPHRSKYSKLQPNTSSKIMEASNLDFTAVNNHGNGPVNEGSVRTTQSVSGVMDDGLALNLQNQNPSKSQRQNYNPDMIVQQRSKFRPDGIALQKAEFHSDSVMSHRANSGNAVSRRTKFHSDSVMSQGANPDTQKLMFLPDDAVSVAKSEGKILEKKEAPGVAKNCRYGNKLQPPVRHKRLQGGAPSVNRSTLSHGTVELYYQTLQQKQWGPAVEVALESLQYKLDVFQANKVLKMLRNHSVAFGFFKWLKRQTGFKHDEHSYTTMIGILGQARQFGIIKRLLEEMTSNGLHPTIVTFNRLIHAYGRANYIGDAVNVFYQMQEAGFEPDRVTYCTLIDIHAKAGYLEVALDLYERMLEVGLSPDTFTYSAMVNCLGKGGYLAAANKLFCEMIEQGCVPNLVTYNIMIALQAKARNYPRAVKLYRDMQAAGFRPDKITYSIVMEVLGHCGRLDEVETVFMEMQQNWVPDEPAYGILVDLWGKAGNLDKARAWYQSMLDAGLRPNVPTCNSLLSAFLKVCRFSDACDVLQNMLVLGLVPSLQTYTLLLSWYTEIHPERGLCCKLMAITGHPAHTFLVSLPDAEPGGQNVRDHTSSFFDLMHSEDRESKRGLVDAIVDFLHKSGLKEEAGLVWEVATERNLYPGSVREKKTSYWLINLHVMSEGTAVTALSRTLAWFRRRMLSSGVGPRRIDVITGWGRRSRITGSSLVRQSIEELLYVFGFPFFNEHSNSGCFIGRGEPLNRWLLNSFVERMHLL